MLSTAANRGPGSRTMPPPPPYGMSSILRCRSPAKSRRSCRRTSTRPPSRARLTMLCDSGPSNIAGKAVMMSNSIQFQQALGRVDRDAPGDHVDGLADGARDRQKDLLLCGRPAAGSPLDGEKRRSARVHHVAHPADLAPVARPHHQADQLENIVAALGEVNQPLAGYQDILPDETGRGTRIVDSPELQDDAVAVVRVGLDRQAPRGSGGMAHQDPAP